MFIVLRKTSVKKTVLIATILIMIGISLSNPFKASASSNLFYLYPYPSNNPSQSVLFWSEANPELGAYNLGMWSQYVPNKQIVIGLPEGYGISSAMFLGNNLGKFITAKMGKGVKSKITGKTVNPKDTIVYERNISPEGISEKIKVEIVDHFKDNDNFQKYMEIITNNITPNEVPDKPTPTSNDNSNAQAVMLFGNTLILGGTALLLLKLAPFLLL